MERLEQHDASRRGSARLHRIDWERIGSQIRKYRRREHLRQRDLAARISSTTNTISRLEGGGIGCSLECLLEICNALSVSPDALLFGNFSPESSSFHDYEGIDLPAGSGKYRAHLFAGSQGRRFRRPEEGTGEAPCPVYGPGFAKKAKAQTYGRSEAGWRK